MSDLPEFLQAARVRLSIQRPYISAVLWNLHPVEKKDLGTLGVNQHWQLFYDPALESKWTIPQAAAVLYHEVGHLLRDHPGRAEMYPPEELIPELWNLVGDAFINDGINAEGTLTLPEGHVTSATLGVKIKDRLEEDVYDELRSKAKKIKATGVTAGDCGSCARGHDPGDGEGSKGPKVSAAEAQVIRGHVAQEIMDHSKQKGDTPAWLRRWAEKILNPTIPWQRLLRAYVRQSIADTKGMTDYSYHRPSRRQSAMPDVIMPSMRAPSVRVKVVLDTSGSMGPDDLSIALGEINGVIRACGVQGVEEVLCCDAAVASYSRKVYRAEQVKIAGGGGTSMTVGIDEAVKTRPHIVIVLTDGYTDWPPAPYHGTKIIAGIIGQETQGVPEWIKSLKIEKKGR